MGLTVQDKDVKQCQAESCAAMDGPRIDHRSAELEKKLRARAVREDLVQKNILPDFSSSPILFQQTKELQKKKVYTTYYVLRVLLCPTSLSVYNMHNTAHVSCLCALVGFSLYVLRSPSPRTMVYTY
jgi:hypothetical protein